MFFKRIRERIPFLSSNKTHLSRKKESERIVLDEANQLISEEKYKKALKAINITIDNGITTNQILFKKAFLLAQTKNREEANKIWENLSNLQNKPKLAASAKQCLETSKKIEAERINSVQHLIENLHARANKYQHKLIHLPTIRDWSPEVDIIPIIQKEAELARTADLPKLSADFIEQALRAGLESPLLIHDKALSLGMMGRHSTALELLNDLSQGIKNPEIKQSIEACKARLNNSANFYNSKKIFYLIKQVRIIASTCSFDPQLIPEDASTHTEQESKSLVFREAANCLEKKPEASLWLANSILDYYPDDGASIHLKGEALAVLKRNDEAIQTWRKLTYSENKDVAERASQSISRILTQKALDQSTLKSPEEAISLFIREHIELKIAPIFNKELSTILEKLQPSNTDFSDPELETQQFQLVFNTLVIEHLEGQLIEQGRLSLGTTGQKPGAISKTASKAG